MVTEPSVVQRYHPQLPNEHLQRVEGEHPEAGGGADPCGACAHGQDVHVVSGPGPTPWCRLCYAHPRLHRLRDHAFVARP